MLNESLFYFAVGFSATGFIGFVLGLRLLCGCSVLHLSRLETGACYGIVIAWALTFSYIVVYLIRATQ